MSDQVEQACEVMHDAYERAAVGAGWETNPKSRKPWADVPEANKATMRAAVQALLAWLPQTEANLGLATTQQLIGELAARADVAVTIGEDWPLYRTVSDA